MKELAKECLGCPSRPCQSKGCPLANHIPDFIAELREENYKKAYEILTETTVLSGICGKICPRSSQCEGSCVRNRVGDGTPTHIGAFESYVSDMAIKYNWEFKDIKDENYDVLKTKKVAVVGSGPAGLTCAAFLARKGVQVTIYEKEEKLGGLITYGIPYFRLERGIIANTINKIITEGNINVKTNMKLGKDFGIDTLKQEYDAIFLGLGANLGKVTFGNFKTGNQLLEEISREQYVNGESNVAKSYNGKKVAISGGGNVAIDTARMLKRNGAEVTIIYRRSSYEMPAEIREVNKAKEEGVKFKFLTNILGQVTEGIPGVNLKCIETELVEKDGESRRVPVNIPGTEFIMEFDDFILANGAVADTRYLEENQFEVDENGYLKVNERYETSIEGVYAGGDLIGTRATVATAAKCRT